VPIAGALRPAPDGAVCDHGEVATLEQALRRLADRCPLPCDAVVELKPIQEAVWGTTRREGGVVLIDLSSGGCVPVQVNTLIHEWAHAMVLDFTHKFGESSSHGDLWGAAFSRAYRAVFQMGGGPPWDANGAYRSTMRSFNGDLDPDGEDDVDDVDDDDWTLYE
jgi:hypothetical protein